MITKLFAFLYRRFLAAKFEDEGGDEIFSSSEILSGGGQSEPSLLRWSCRQYRFEVCCWWRLWKLWWSLGTDG